MNPQLIKDLEHALQDALSGKGPATQAIARDLLDRFRAVYQKHDAPFPPRVRASLTRSGDLLVTAADQIHDPRDSNLLWTLWADPTEAN